jgi:DsbC/DsbD-like thiol-disulfide interchange protein
MARPRAEASAACAKDGEYVKVFMRSRRYDGFLPLVLAAILLGGLALVSRPAAAAITEGVTRLALVAASSAHNGGPVLAGIDLGLAPGWKTYWRKPGDSGIAPRFDWSASENVAGVELLWPAPSRFDEPGDITFGYRNGVLWPVRVVPEDPALPVTLRLDMHYGICSDICVPREAALELLLPSMPPDWQLTETASAERLDAALARVPVPPTDPDILDVRWREDAAPTLEVRLKECGADCTPPALIAEGPRNVWFSTPRVKREGDSVVYVMEVEVLSPAMLDGKELTFTLSGPDTALSVRKKM